MPVISTTSLTKTYGRRRGIESVDLAVNAGTILGFLGPNGAGKTTTIRILLGFLRATAGSATIFGHDCWRKSHVLKRDLGYLPSDLRLYPWMNGERAVRVVQRIRGVDLDQSAQLLAERFDLEMNVRVRKMSRGMRQKLGIILALAHRPKLLVLDEPTTGLDPLMQQVLAEVLREFAAAGHTVFFSSHTLSEVEPLCDRVAIIKRGRIVADETIDSLRTRARRSVVLTFKSAKQVSTVSVPNHLRVVERSGALWRCELLGPATSILEWASRQPLADIRIGPADLEMLFQSFYRDKNPS